ncbi:MAG: pyruvate ferredoxin oxidoreductase [Firmicutes bacterium]|nr:pyruvate ferredoxin oxidoreductase [Bacillota bacterium]
MSNNKCFVSGDEAVALGARLARPNVISAYPITPQTIVVERLSEFVEDGSLEAEFMHVESEHSAMSAAMGVSSVGARAFTATSSQGLLHMSEGLHYASGARFPIVMMNANRALAVPWSIYGDQSDSMSQLNSGWIQVYVEDAQEALDMTIQAYKIAEDGNVLTPFMVNLDGFILTHTYELLNLPNQEEVDEFLPKYETENKMDLENPKSLCFSSTPLDNLEFKYQQHMAMINSKEVIEKVDKDYGDKFGRYYGGLIEEYKCDDASVLLVTVGSVTGTARVVVDNMRSEGIKVGLVKLRYMRPFPEEKIIELSKNVDKIGVIDKNISHGYEGTVFTHINSALSKMNNSPKAINFIGGMGGRDISKEDIKEIFKSLLTTNEDKEKTVQFIGMGCEIDE